MRFAISILPESTNRYCDRDPIEILRVSRISQRPVWCSELSRLFKYGECRRAFTCDFAFACFHVAKCDFEFASLHFSQFGKINASPTISHAALILASNRDLISSSGMTFPRRDMFIDYNSEIMHSYI